MQKAHSIAAMPGRRRRSPNTDGDNDVPPAQLCMLMRQYKIRFLKYVTDWPEEHRHVFGIIKQIGRELYTTYKPNEDRDDLTVAQTRKRVSKVVRAANRDYEIRPNEETLRIHTEPLVFKRFESEVKW